VVTAVADVSITVEDTKPLPPPVCLAGAVHNGDIVMCFGATCAEAIACLNLMLEALEED